MKKLLSIVLVIMLSLNVFSGCNSSSEPNTVSSSTEASVDVDAIAASSAIEATVLSVIDGDTITVLIAGKKYTVRYIGMDAPDQYEPGYEEARTVNEKLAFGEKVVLERDVSNTDQYGRLLRYVWVGDQLVNALIVINGYAQVDIVSPDVKYKDYLLDLQNRAKSADAGLWTSYNPSTIGISKESPGTNNDTYSSSTSSSSSSSTQKTTSSSDSNLVEARVTNIVDGDTIDVLISGVEYRVRYIGMNTPERDEYGFSEATQANAQLVSDKTVTLEKDVSETDRYGRLLRYVWVEDSMVNAVLVANGYAQVATYPPDVKYQYDFLELQRQAEASGLGLWATQSVQQPSSTTTASVKYVGSVNSNKYHYPGCQYAQQISPSNEIWFSSAAEALAAGYVPCKGCNPPTTD